MTQFCPRCTMPLEVTPDPSRLCETCGWFGDASETLTKLPPMDEFNPVLAAAQNLSLYRDMCRGELIVEQVYDAGDAVEDDLNKAKKSMRSATKALMEMFVNLHGLRNPEAQARRIILKIADRLHRIIGYRLRHLSNRDAILNQIVADIQHEIENRIDP